MQMMPPPFTKDLVLVGGGHTHALVLRMWAMRPLPGVRLTLISPDPTTAYSGMLPGHIAGHYSRKALEIDLVKLARIAGARLVLARAEGIDRETARVLVTGRAPIAYDILSIDVGITSDMPALPGFTTHAVPAKPLDGFADRWENFARTTEAGKVKADVAVIGGGLAGVELALAARHRLGPAATVTLIEASRPLEAVGRGARAALLNHLAKASVTIVTEAATEIGAGFVLTSGGKRIASAFTIGAAGTRAPDWFARTGLQLTDGFLTIGPTLQTVTDPAIFAAGDCAHMSHAPRPKAGVFAVRQAPTLLANLRAAALGQPVAATYQPQSDYLKLVSTGARNAVADKWGLPLDGAALWRWKDRIDRKFMAMFHDMKPMATPGQTDDQPLCGGCGAKVGREALHHALADLPKTQRNDVVLGAGDDAAILRHGTGFQVFTTDHLRAFTDDPGLLARITAIHALGDIWSMGARPQAALAQIILPVMAPRQQTETLREIMTAAAEIFGPEGADIVGGHTSLGAELTIGFSVTGLCDGPATSHAGAQPGDVLILTKPIGTGVLLAAEMQARAEGHDVAAAWASMSRPSGEAARILAPVAHAMTDVTGFGLAGHLLTILEASGLSADLTAAAIPILPGAHDLTKAGVASSLLPQNRLMRNRVRCDDAVTLDLLFDPQTAGGLLATVSASHAAETLARLCATGEPAAIIGTLKPGLPMIDVSGTV